MAVSASASPSSGSRRVADEPSSARPERDAWHRWAVPLGLGLLHLILALLAFDPTPHTGGDNAAYIALARSLIEGRGYLELWDPATLPHTVYPPAFPGLLALAMLLGLESWAALKLLVVFISAAAVALTVVGLRRAFGAGIALVVGAVVAVSPGVVALSHWVLSDVPFWALTVLALWGFERLEAGERGGLAVAVLATVLAYFTRSAGLPLVAVAALWLSLRRDWRSLAVLAATLLPLILLWWLRSQAQGGVEYVNQFWMVDPYRPELGRIGAADLVERVWDNNVAYMRVHVPILLFGRASPALAVPGILVGVAAIVGWALRLRRPGLAELFFPLYIGLIYVWPAVWAGDRFFLPALPLAVAYAAYALHRAVRRVRPGAAVWVGGGAVALVALIGAPSQIEGMRRGQACTTAYRLGSPYPCLPEAWRDFFEVAEWTAANLPEDAVVLSRKPRLFYALSGHRGRIYPPSPEPAELVRVAEEAGARYIVLDFLTGQAFRYLVPALTGRPEAFCVVHAPGPDRPAVLGVLPGAGSVPDAAEPSARFTVCPADYASSSVPSR